MSLHYFELPKLPDTPEPSDEQKLWLKLFKAETEEELKQLEELGVPVMEQAIDAYRSVSATSEFKELERLRFLARHNEASAPAHARREGVLAEREKWQSALAEKDTVLAKQVAAMA
jgi:hypothetical protein